MTADNLSNSAWLAANADNDHPYEVACARAIKRLMAENEALRIDAECFRFLVREVEQAPVAMATLIMRCVTEQEYRDAIMPCVSKANAAISKASKV